MAIPGLRSPEVAPVPVVEVNVGDRAALALEALRILDRIEGDPEEVLEGIRDEFDALAKRTDRVSETYVELQFGGGFTPPNMLTSIDGVRYPGDRTYPTTYPLEESPRNVSRRLWLPEDPSKEGYSIAEINRLDVVKEGEAEPAVRPAHARLALLDGPVSEDPMLHMLDLPYDDMYAEKGQPTQLSELERMQREFGAEHPELELNATNLAGFVMIALQHRIEGTPMPVGWGFMRIPQLGRKTVDGGSWVGDVYSRGDRLGLDGSSGRARPSDGVGLSVGQKLELQAS